MTFLNKKEYAESTIAVAKSQVKLLTMRKDHYNILTMQLLRAISANFQLRASWRGARLLDAQKAKTEMELAMADASGHPVLPPHLEGSASSGVLSYHYMKAIAASGVRPRHLRHLPSDGGRHPPESGYDSNMINVFELREMGLDKILDASGNDLNKVRKNAAKEHRTLVYQTHLPSLAPVCPSEPSFRLKPAHWYWESAIEHEASPFQDELIGFIADYIGTLSTTVVLFRRSEESQPQEKPLTVKFPLKVTYVSCMGSTIETHPLF